MTVIVTFLVITVIAVATVFILEIIHEDHMRNGTPLPQEGLHHIHAY